MSNTMLVHFFVNADSNDISKLTEMLYSKKNMPHPLHPNESVLYLLKLLYGVIFGL